MDYPANGDGAGGNHSPPWDDGTKKRKTSNSAAGRRASAAAEEAERYIQVAGSYLAPPPPSVEMVIASNPFDDSHPPQYNPGHNHVSQPPPPQPLVAAPPRAPPPGYPYDFGLQMAPRFEQPFHARPPQSQPSRAKPKYPGDPGPTINTKSRMLLGGGNVNVQQHSPPQPSANADSSIDDLSMPPLPPQASFEPRACPDPSLDHLLQRSSPLNGSLDNAASQPMPGPALCTSTRKRKLSLAASPAQPYCPPVVWGRDGQAHFQPPMSQLDPQYIGSLPYSPARCSSNGLGAPILHGQLTLPAANGATMQAPADDAEQQPRSPQLVDECAACREFVYSNEEPVWCRASCGLVYHRRCTNLHETAHYLITNTPNVAWMCETCERNKPDAELVKFGQ